MKNTFIMSLLSVVIFGLSSCIQDEPLYREADIVSFTVESELFVSSHISGNGIKLRMLDTDTAMYKNMAPVIKVSPGAIVSPASCVAMDFTKGITYKVISEDGNYSKEYSISLIPIPNYVYGFEEWTTEVWASREYPALLDPNWASANMGVAIAKGASITDYPTRSTTDAKSGQYAALLETIKGGKYLGQNIPIFSGSLFTGEFKLSFPALKSTHFGQPHPKEKGKPVKMTGYYKYTPGPVYKDKDENVIPGKIDECDIKAVLYSVTKGNAANEWLNGETIADDLSIIAVAQLEDRSKREEYTHFSIDFIYKEEPDYRNNDYKLSIIFASSARGDFYEGAVGSTLIIDDVEVVCEPYDGE